MSNDSATGGVLTPAVTPAPLAGQSLDNFLQQLIALVSGLEGKFVRPRWQPEPPNMPPRDHNWAAVGIMRASGDTFAAVVHSPGANGSDIVFRQEVLEVLVSFYGPDAMDHASLLREGLSVPQNREVLTANDMSLVEVGDLTPAPSLINERWQYRVDATVTICRAIRRSYPVLNLLSVTGNLITDSAPPLGAPINVQET